MAGTPLSPTARYIPPGTREWLFVPDDGIEDISAPTRAELDTGTDLTAEVKGFEGFTLTSEFVDTPDLGSRVTSKIPGRITLPDSSLTFWADEGSDDVRTVLPQDTKGFIVHFPEGDGPDNGGPGTLMDVWPVTVASEGHEGGMEDPAGRMVSFATTTPPALNIEIPPAP